MKKLFCVMLTILLSMSLLAGCGAEKDDGTYRVAIVQQLDHASLNEIRDAVQKQLDTLAEEKGITITYKDFNGQNDTTVLNQIGAQVVSDEYDLIIPIATTAAQCMVTAAEGTQIPIVYAAVSDPENAGLTDLPNVTGVSDALNTPYILDMMLEVQPEIKTVGLLYSLSEPNSETPIWEAKAYLEEKGIAYLEKTGNAADEVLAAASSLVGRCEAVFTPTDNAVMNAAAAVAEIFADGKIAHYTGADSFVAEGAFATCGVNYTELGVKAADMAVEILLGGEAGPFQVMDGGIIVYNSETAKTLGLDVAKIEEVFTAKANTVKAIP